MGVIILIFLALIISLPREIKGHKIDTKIGWLNNFLDKITIKKGLDLQGGVHLVYEADMKNIEKGKEMEALKGVQDVVERRVNAFGVAEPIIRPSKVGKSYRLIVELAGVKDINQAKQIIKETPLLEFKEEGEAKKELSPAEEKMVEQLALQQFQQMQKQKLPAGVKKMSLEEIKSALREKCYGQVGGQPVSQVNIWRELKWLSIPKPVAPPFF